MLLEIYPIFFERINDGLTSLLVRWYLDSMGGAGSNFNHILARRVLQSLNGLPQRGKCELVVRTLSNGNSTHLISFDQPLNSNSMK